MASLSDEEREHAVVYVDDRVLSPGDEVEIDGGSVRVATSTVVASVDLEPGRPLGHRARHLLLERDTGRVGAVEAQVPPFLRGMPEGWRPVYRAAGVPEWAVAT